MANKISPGVAMTEFLNSIPNDFRPTRHYPNLLAATPGKLSALLRFMRNWQ